MPALKGTAQRSHSRNGVDHQRGYLAYTRKSPGGVGVDGLPVETGITRTTLLSTIASATWRSSSTSARLPGARAIGSGRAVVLRRARVIGPSTPSGVRPTHF